MLLLQMGMNSMFDDTADFAGISPVKLQVSHVLQKTFIEISEEGTEAAAATGMYLACIAIYSAMSMCCLLTTCSLSYWPT
jgi:serpin B